MAKKGATEALRDVLVMAEQFGGGSLQPFAELSIVDLFTNCGTNSVSAKAKIPTLPTSLSRRKAQKRKSAGFMGLLERDYLPLYTNQHNGISERLQRQLAPTRSPHRPLLHTLLCLGANKETEHFKLMPAHRLYFLRYILINEAVKIVFYLKFRAQGFFPFLDHGLELLIKPP